jgi:hypothetical protein
MNPIALTIPQAAHMSRRIESIYRKPDFLGQFTPCRDFRRLPGMDATSWKVPLGAIGRTHETHRPPDVYRHERALMLQAP